MKMGVMGGTFDPIHIAHLIMAEKARSELSLDKVIFIPAGEPWMKSDRIISDADHRVAMVKLAITSNPAFELSTVEVEREGPAYTVDTLEKLLYDLGKKTAFFLLTGWDSLATMPLWKDPSCICRRATIVTFPRPGCVRPEIEKLEKDIPGISGRIIFMENPLLEVSSSGIRSAVAAGKSIRYLVPQEVEEYIRDRGLYKKS